MKRSTNKSFNLLIIFVTLCFLFFVGMESLAFARAGGGRSSGSRGFSSGRSYQRSVPSQPRQQQAAPQRPPGQQPAAAPSFGRSLLYGMGSGLLGGMIGSMIFGGRGYAGGGAGGWGGGGFGFGDLIMILIVLGIIYFVVKRYRARKQEMQMSAAGAGYSQSYGYNDPAPEQAYGSSSYQEDPVSQGLRYISQMDPSFDENRFKELVEDNFFKIQSAWTKRDMSGVRYLLSAQMLNTFQEDVNRHAANKQVNRLENIAVRQVEIVDAAQDQGEEYITVKFLASLLDYTVDETSNQVISGNSTDPVKFLEYWTFNRKTGEKSWVLAGITQEGDYR